MSALAIVAACFGIVVSCAQLVVTIFVVRALRQLERSDPDQR